LYAHMNNKRKMKKKKKTIGITEIWLWKDPVRYFPRVLLCRHHFYRIIYSDSVSHKILACHIQMWPLWAAAFSAMKENTTIYLTELSWRLNDKACKGPL
jgi:hypothetical protein